MGACGRANRQALVTYFADGGTPDCPTTLAVGRTGEPGRRFSRPRSYRPAMYATILVPTDGSAPATAAAEHALDLAAATGAAVHLLSVVDTADLGLTTPPDIELEEVRSSIRSAAERAVADLADRADERGIGATTAIRVGDPSQEILDAGEAMGADLVVMGTHGRTGLAHVLLGSTAERVVRRATVPVLTVRDSESERESSR